MFVSGSRFCADLLWLTFYRMLGSHDVEIGSKIYWCSRILPCKSLGRPWPSYAGDAQDERLKGTAINESVVHYVVRWEDYRFFWVGAGTGRAGAQGLGYGGFEDGRSMRTPGTRSRAEEPKAIWSPTILYWTGGLTLTTV